jgi:two-component system sensor histidine kinase KdpD
VAGAGLGLAIVAAVAQAHGGSVSASNRAVGGADVALTLPALTESKRAPARASALTHD